MKHLEEMSHDSLGPLIAQLLGVGSGFLGRHLLEGRLLAVLPARQGLVAPAMVAAKGKGLEHVVGHPQSSPLFPRLAKPSFTL